MNRIDELSISRKRKEAASGGGNICLACNGNEDVDPG